MTYRIRRATLEDLPDILALRREAERWLAYQGIRQWTTDYAAEVYPRWIEAVDHGLSWLVMADGDDWPVGHVALSDKPDSDFWLPQDDPESGLYLGKMTVARRAAGCGLGDAILNWAGRRAETAGKQWLRLECRRDNTRLQGYYLARKFEHVRTAKPPRRRTESGALFQRPAGLEFVPDGVPAVSLSQPCAATNA